MTETPEETIARLERECEMRRRDHIDACRQVGELCSAYTMRGDQLVLARRAIAKARKLLRGERWPGVVAIYAALSLRKPRQKILASGTAQKISAKRSRAGVAR